MNQAAQQISPDPARDFANAILAETNGARDLIELLHEISQGNYDANQNDRIEPRPIPSWIEAFDFANAVLAEADGRHATTAIPT